MSSRSFSTFHHSRHKSKTRGAFLPVQGDSNISRDGFIHWIRHLLPGWTDLIWESMDNLNMLHNHTESISHLLLSKVENLVNSCFDNFGSIRLFDSDEHIPCQLFEKKRFLGRTLAQYAVRNLLRKWY